MLVITGLYASKTIKICKITVYMLVITILLNIM